MSKKEVPLSSDKLSQLIVKGMQEKKALGIQVLDLRKVNNAVADFFVVCTGNSDTHIAGISESITEEVYKITKEHNDSRIFYGIEDLWSDAKITEVEESA